MTRCCLAAWILSASLTLTSSLFAAEPSRADLEVRLQLIQAKRAEMVAQYRYAQTLQENAILKDSAYESEERNLKAQLEVMKKTEKKKAE